MSSATLTLAERVTILTRTYAAIQTYFAHQQAIPDFDLDTAYQQTLETALPLEDRRRFGLEMMAFIAQLHNGHSWYFDPWLQEQHGQPLGFKLFRDPLEGWVARATRVQQLALGEIIGRFAGRDVDEFVADYRRLISASSERAAMLRLGQIRYALPLQFTLECADEMHIAIDRSNLAPLSMDTEGRWLVPDGIAYIRIPSFGAPQQEEDALRYLTDYKDAAGLVIDVRGNGGGTTPAKLVAALMDRPYRYYAESTRAIFAVFRANMELASHIELDEQSRTALEATTPLADAHLMWYPRYQEAVTPVYGGPLVILTDGWTVSAAEDFVLPFKDNGRATIIGERTQGSTGQPYMAEMSNGIRVFIGAKRAYFPDGSPFEGIGIAPDIEVQPGMESLQAGRDPVLDKARVVLGAD